MDRNNFAACAVFALPLAILSVGCDATPSGPSRSPRTTTPVVLAELQRFTPGSWRDPADAQAAQFDEQAGVPSESAEMHAEGDAATSKTIAIRPMPAPLTAETPDAPSAPEPESQAPLDDSADDVAPASDVDARIVFPSGGVDMDAPISADSPAPQTQSLPATEPPARAAVVPAPEPERRSELPWNHAAPRSPQMMAVAERADGRVQRAFQLAGRGALYSARAEFIAALQGIAQANDAEQNTRLYTKALTAGLVALKESNDFVRPIAGTSQVDVARLLTSHKTPILKDIPVAGLTPMQAAQRYYTYAQEQLAAGAAQERSGSMALFGLAKVAIALAGNNKSQQLESAAQAMTLYQAALIAEPRNFLAANELGVLLAQNGNLPRARDWLLHSVSLSPHTAAWQNLAAVHARLGEARLAEHARTEALALQQGGQSESAPQVQWVDAETFVRTAPVSDSVLPAVTPLKSPAPAAPATNQPARETAKRGLSDWLPWNARR